MNIINSKKYRNKSQNYASALNYNKNAFNILKCNNNNKSKTCPSLLCNLEKQKQQNNDIFKRNFPDIKINPIENYRPTFDICHKIIDLNKNNYRLNQNLNNKITNFNNIKTDFLPGKGIGTMFLKTIDIDTELKCINYKNSLCPREKYLPNTNCNNKLNKLKNPYCQLYKYKHGHIKTYKNKNYNKSESGQMFFQSKKIWNNLTKRKNME